MAHNKSRTVGGPLPEQPHPEQQQRLSYREGKACLGDLLVLDGQWGSPWFQCHCLWRCCRRRRPRRGWRTLCKTTAASFQALHRLAFFISRFFLPPSEETRFWSASSVTGPLGLKKSPNPVTLRLKPVCESACLTWKWIPESAGKSANDESVQTTNSSVLYGTSNFIKWMDPVVRDKLKNWKTTFCS